MKNEQEALAWINSNPATLSLLYDLNRMPEQLQKGSREWIEMLLIAAHMKAVYDEGRQAAAQATADG
jgi:hypothetical protein